MRGLADPDLPWVLPRRRRAGIFGPAFARRLPSAFGLRCCGCWNRYCTGSPRWMKPVHAVQAVCTRALSLPNWYAEPDHAWRLPQCRRQSTFIPQIAGRLIRHQHRYRDRRPSVRSAPTFIGIGCRRRHRKDPVCCRGRHDRTYLIQPDHLARL